MSKNNTGARRDWLVGLILIVLGLLFFVEQWFDFSFGDVLWPLFVLVPGLVLFFLMAAGGEGANFLAIPACMTTAVGMLLFYQNTFDHFESWAYAWSLIFPTSFGIGLYLFGDRTDNPDTKTTGKGFIRVGLIIFAIGAVFFELVIGISNSAVSRYGLPVLLIAIGILLLVRRGSKPGAPRKPAVQSKQAELEDAPAEMPGGEGEPDDE